MSNSFWYKTFVAVCGNLERKLTLVDNVLWSHKQEIYPTTSLDENRIEFKNQPDRNLYVDLREFYLAFKKEIVKSCGYETYNNKDVRKEHKEEAK